MARRSPQHREEKEVESTETRPTPEPKPVKTAKLRLVQNEYVRGTLHRAGSVHDFTPEEAERRLKTTQKWVIA